MDDLRLSVIGLVSYATTCQKRNTNEWMVGFVQYLNSVLERLGDDDRFIYNYKQGMIRRKNA